MSGGMTGQVIGSHDPSAAQIKGEPFFCSLLPTELVPDSTIPYPLTLAWTQSMDTRTRMERTAWGIQAGLGWNSEELDALLPRIFPQVKPGEYKRVCALLEKAVYGEIPPEIYEERTIAAFLRKLSVGRPQKGMRYRFLSRYRWVDLV